MKGSGGPLLVIHGGPLLDHTYLAPFLDPLSRDHLLIFYDQDFPVAPLVRYILRLSIFNKTGYFPFIEKLDEFLEVVNRFLQFID